MDDVQVGSVIRAVRIRRGLRQSDVAALAGVSQTMVSDVEAGHLEQMSLRLVRRVGAAVGVSLPLGPRWRGPELVKLLDEKHAAMVGEVVERLRDLGWQAIPEHTFSIQGERGSVDVFAWHPITRAVLVVEVKTMIRDLQDLVSTLDRKRRLGPLLARRLDWRPLLFGTVLVLPGETQARNAVGKHLAVLDAVLPARTIDVRRWLTRPDRDLRGIWFLLNFAGAGSKRASGGPMRVRRRRASGPRKRPRSESCTPGATTAPIADPSPPAVT
jgi:transcriptional regulator with XRE-family HTH domain